MNPANTCDLEEIRRLLGNMTLSAEGVCLHEGREITQDTLIKNLVEREGYYGLLLNNTFYPLKYTQGDRPVAQKPGVPVLRVVRPPIKGKKEVKKTARKAAVKSATTSKKKKVAKKIVSARSAQKHRRNKKK